jgi:hypothetical protein
MPENVLMPSMRMLRVMGMRKLSRRKMVSVVTEAEYQKRYIRVTWRG